MKTGDGKARRRQAVPALEWAMATGRSVAAAGFISSAIEREAYFHSHLPVGNLVVFQVAAHLGDLEPLHIADRLASSRDGVIYGLLDPFWRGAHQLDLFIDVITHEPTKPLPAPSGENISLIAKASVALTPIIVQPRQPWVLTALSSADLPRRSRTIAVISNDRRRAA